MTLQDILKPNKTRKIVIFGTGGLAKNIFTHLAGFEIAYFVDNNSSKWGGNFLGLSINNPNVLVNEPRGSVIVLIASSFVILAQKTRLVLVPYENFWKQGTIPEAPNFLVPFPFSFLVGCSHFVMLYFSTLFSLICLSSMIECILAKSFVPEVHIELQNFIC